MSSSDRTVSSRPNSFIKARSLALLIFMRRGLTFSTDRRPRRRPRVSGSPSRSASMSDRSASSSRPSSLALGLRPRLARSLGGGGCVPAALAAAGLSGRLLASGRQRPPSARAGFFFNSSSAAFFSSADSFRQWHGLDFGAAWARRRGLGLGGFAGALAAAFTVVAASEAALRGVDTADWATSRTFERAWTTSGSKTDTQRKHKRQGIGAGRHGAARAARFEGQTLRGRARCLGEHLGCSPCGGVGRLCAVVTVA